MHCGLEYESVCSLTRGHVIRVCYHRPIEKRLSFDWLNKLNVCDSCTEKVTPTKMLDNVASAVHL